MLVSSSEQSYAGQVAHAGPVKAPVAADAPAGQASAPPPAVTTHVSAFASRLSRAAADFDARTSKLSHDALGDKVRATIAKITYTLTPDSLAAMAREVPDPADADALASAAAANAYVADLSRPNPFAGRSRDQLSAIVNDESGAFTTNEKRAAYCQAYAEEQAWLSRVVADGMNEYHRTGKMTNFFASALDHFKALPRAEQSLYPSDYADDLQDKVALDFNYFTHMPHGSPGKAKISLANLRSMARFDD